MGDQPENVNPLFLHLVLSLQSAAMYQMGKTASPISGKIERDMLQAKISIDLLTMLQEKTKGNLLEEEKRAIDSIVYNLQLNFVDEMNKDQLEKAKSEPGNGHSEDSGKSEEPPSEDDAEK